MFTTFYGNHYTPISPRENVTASIPSIPALRTSINTLTQQNFQEMGDIMPAGGPTQDEVMAISLFKMGLGPRDTVFDLGCGTGKVSIAAAGLAKKVYAVDRRRKRSRTRRMRQNRPAGPISNFTQGKRSIFSRPPRSPTVHLSAGRSRSKRSSPSFPKKYGGSSLSMPSS